MTQQVATQAPLTGLQKIEGKLDVERLGATAVSTSAGGLAFESLAEVLEVAKLMALADVAVPKHLRANPGACLAVTIQAVEWKFSPFAVANKSYSVNDRLAYEAQLIHAVILARAPIKQRPEHEYSGEGAKRKLRVWAETVDGQIVDYESPEIGSIKPKNSPLWTNDPDQQLHYFSVRSWCRRHFPDVILGVYAKDEMEDAGLKDVTPPTGSGLADRLTANQTNGGFDPASIDAALGEAQGGQDGSAATSAPSDQQKPASEPAAEPEKVIGADAEHDPEIVRAGATAASDGQPRQSPDDLSPADAAAWLNGYDSVKAKAA